MNDSASWWEPPRSIKWLIGLYFACVLLFTLLPVQVTAALALRAPLFASPGNALRLFTYPFVVLGLLHWAYISLFIWASSVVLKEELSESRMLVALAAGAVGGGVVFGLTATNQAVIGGVLAGWGLAGAVIGAFVRNRDGFDRWRRAYVFVLLGWSLVTAVAGTGMNLAILAAILSGGITGYFGQRRRASEAAVATLA